VLAAVVEQEPLAGDELAHDVRDEDLAALGLGGDARGDDDRRTEEVVVLGDGLARVEADTDADAGIGA